MRVTVKSNNGAVEITAEGSYNSIAREIEKMWLELKAMQSRLERHKRTARKAKGKKTR